MSDLALKSDMTTMLCAVSLTHDFTVNLCIVNNDFAINFTILAPYLIITMAHSMGIIIIFRLGLLRKPDKLKFLNYIR